MLVWMRTTGGCASTTRSTSAAMRRKVQSVWEGGTYVRVKDAMHRILSKPWLQKEVTIWPHQRSLQCWCGSWPMHGCGDFRWDWTGHCGFGEFSNDLWIWYRSQETQASHVADCPGAAGVELLTQWYNGCLILTLGVSSWRHLAGRPAELVQSLSRGNSLTRWTTTTAIR